MSRIETQFDVVVVGAGPAGIAAAVRASECGAKVGLVDDNLSLGGQIWRGEHSDSGSEASWWIDKARAANVKFFAGVRVIDQPTPNVLRGEGITGPIEIAYRKLILATGARERFLPFPGWTLQNVTGAGALQALVKCGLPIKGKRVVVAGTGPLLLAVAAYLRNAGAVVLVVCEQGSPLSLAKFGVRLLGHPAKLRQALSLRKDLAGIRRLPGSWPMGAQGDRFLRSVVISHAGKFETLDCDYLACGFHLVPNTELASLLGCGLEQNRVVVDDFQASTRADVYCAGEPTGIGGVELAVIEGQIAGFAAAGEQRRSEALFRERQKLRGFAQALERAFALRSELRSIVQPETIVCRCEDVTYDRLANHSSWRAAKLHTRCGMGPCQGRVCGPAAEFLFGWKTDSARPPVFPAQISTLAHGPVSDLNSVESATMRGQP